MMKHYRITNRHTNQRYDVTADSAQQACAIVGWHIGYCYVQGPSDKPFKAPIESAKEPEKS